MTEPRSTKRHSATVEFLRGKLTESVNKEKWVTLWLVAGISLTGFFFACIIIYFLWWSHHR